MRKEKKYHYIYITTNLLNSRYYYGMHSTDNLEDNYLGSGTYLRRAINKHGKENFTREILEFCKTRKELKSRARDIVNLQEIANKQCMNLKVGGIGSGLPIGFKHSKETRKKMSDSAMGRKNKPISDKTRKKMSESHSGEKHPMFGKTHSDKSKQKMSDSGKNKIFSVLHKKNISKSISGENHPMYGKTHSDKSKQKMIDNHMGMSGKTHSEETRKKISESNKGQIPWILGKFHSDVSKEKMGGPREKVKCPHCGKIGGVSGMKRYHFDNCKF